MTEYLHSDGVFCDDPDCDRAHTTDPNAYYKRTERQLIDRLRDLIAGSHEVVPWQNGETFYRHCAKAGQAVPHKVLVYTGATFALCSGPGCLASVKVENFPVRYRVSDRELRDAAVAALPALLDALEQHISMPEEKP